MKGKLLIMTVLTGLAFSAQAKMSCKILMDGFEADGKKTIYDLNEREKQKYKKCLDDMTLIPNSFKSFEDRSEAEARKRDQEYKKRERQKKDAEERKKIAQTRMEYTFSATELEEIFNKPVFGYRLADRNYYKKSEGWTKHSMQKLTDLSELCAAIGKEHDIKGMKAVSAKMDLSKAKKERDNLNEAGVVIPDSFWTSYELFETDMKTRDKMRNAGARKFRILEFSEVTCVHNENKDDDFEDLNPEVTLVTKTKEFTGATEHDYINISDDLEVGEKPSRDVVNGSDEDDYQREPSISIEDEIDGILGIDLEVENTVFR
jgi:hypothetical protein